MIAQHRMFFASPVAPLKKGFDRIMKGLDHLAMTLGSVGEAMRAGRMIEAQLMSQRVFGGDDRTDYHELVREAFTDSFADRENTGKTDGLPTSPIAAGETVEDCLTVARAELSLAETRLTQDIRIFLSRGQRYDKHVKPLLVQRKRVVDALQALSQSNVKPAC